MPAQVPKIGVPVARELAQRIGEPLALDPERHRRRLAAGDHQAVEALQPRRGADLAHVGSEPAQHPRVRLEVPLQGQDADERHGATSPGCIDAQHLGAEQTHPEHVQGLPIHVLGAHVHVAVEAESAHAVAVATPCWPAPVPGDDPALPHSHREQRLTEGVVDRCARRMGQASAFEEDPVAARRLGQPHGGIYGRRPPDVLRQQTIQFRVKPGIVSRGQVRPFELFDWLDQRLRHVASAEFAEIAPRVGVAASCDGHGSPTLARLTASNKARATARDPRRRAMIRRPTTRRCRTAWTTRIAPATLSACSPPASNTGRRLAIAAARSQSTV